MDSHSQTNMAPLKSPKVFILLFCPEIKEAPFETQTFLSSATYESFRGVTCEVPRTHDKGEAKRGYQVRVSNDGNLWSQPLPLFIFDGHCLTCTTQSMRCEIKVGKYKQHSGLSYCKFPKDSYRDTSADSPLKIRSPFKDLLA